MDIVNPNYLNYMEQIQKNRKDIENLYDQELSDITQLNFKENDENGLDYENGKATFYGKSTIIRDVNTENLEVDSKVELKISSGDDDIVIDAGEDNSTLEIHLDNETRNKINRALLLPIGIPTETKIIAVDTTNSQEMINVGDTLVIEDNELNISNYLESQIGKVRYKDVLFSFTDNMLDITDTEITTLQDLCNLFNQDISLTYRAFIDGSTSNNITNIFGSPPRSEGVYRTYYIKIFNLGLTNQGIGYNPYRCYILFGGNTEGITGVKFLWANATSTYNQSQWNEIV